MPPGALTRAELGLAISCKSMPLVILQLMRAQFMHPHHPRSVCKAQIAGLDAATPRACGSAAAPAIGGRPRCEWQHLCPRPIGCLP